VTTSDATLPRFFVPPSAIHGSTITIERPEEVHHLRDVLRLGKGDRVACFDGTGTEYVGVIAGATRHDVIVQIEQRVERSASPLTVWLAQGLSKTSKTFEWIVQKATELGVARISPLLSRHTVVRLTPDQGRSKVARWQRIAQEAAKQCRRATVPTVDLPQSFEAFLHQVTGLPAPGSSGQAGRPLILMPTLAVTAIPLSEALKESHSSETVLVLIGPEGDFSPEEVALAQAHGARPVSLGTLTLRTETAAIAVLAVIRCAFGQM